MNIRNTALITVFVAVTELLKTGDSQNECGYLRGEIQLEGGRNAREGRIRVCNDGLWGRICDQGWDHNDAIVACQQLGLLTSDTVAIAVNGSYFGEGSGSVWLSDLSCTGTEQTLVDCLTDDQQRLQWPALQCDTYAGLICLETDDGENVRLVGGRDEREGRVEVFWEGRWGAVCGGTSWETVDAEVVCRELGMLDSVSAIAVNGDQFATSTTSIVLLDGIECTGEENHLILCHGGAWGRQQQCATHAAGVACLTSDGCSDGDLRLVEGRTSTKGRVEACHGGLWGTVCKEDDSEWNNTDADIVCRQLGFQDPDEIGAQTANTALFGQATGVIWLFTTTCGNQQSCMAQNWTSTSCSHSNDVAVSCPEPKKQFHACVDISAETLFMFETLYSFYNSVATSIVDEVLASCSQPCSYTTRDFTFDSSIPSPIQPTTMCMPRNATLGVRVTCRYRPYLNENGRVQLVTYRTLGAIGMTINCADYRGFVSTKDIILDDCNLEIPTGLTHSAVTYTSHTIENAPQNPNTTMPLSIALTSTPKDISVPQKSITTKKASEKVSSSVGISDPSNAVNSKPSITVSLHRSITNGNTVSSTVNPSTVSVSIPHDTTAHHKINNLMAVMIGLLVTAVILLVLCILASVLLCLRRRSLKKKASGAKLTTSPQHNAQIQSTNPFAPVNSSHNTTYYEDMDSHDYAVLEQQASLPRQSLREGTPLSSTGATSTGHENIFLNHLEKTVDIQQPSTKEKVELTSTTDHLRLSDCNPKGLYSKLNNHTRPEYATLEPDCDPSSSSVPTSNSEDFYSQLSQVSCRPLQHEYQHVLPDSSGGYDRTFSTISFSTTFSKTNNS